MSTITGNNSSNTLNGTARADTIDAKGGNDKIRGYGGDDILYGGLGSDTFIFESTASANGVDTLMDYSYSATRGAEQDILDFSLMFGSLSSRANISNYARFQVEGGKVVLQVDKDGAGTRSTWETIAVFNNFTGGEDVRIKAGTSFFTLFDAPPLELPVAPTDITFTYASGSGIQENSAGGTAIANLSALDANTLESFDYFLVNSGSSTDDDNGLVEIVGNQIRVKSGATIDYETNPILDVYVRVEDKDGLTYDKALQLSVLNVNEAPTLTAIDTFTGALEDQALTITYADLAGKANEADADGDTISFVIKSITALTTLEIKKGAEGSWVVASVDDIITSADQVRWTPAANAFGSALTAFTVVAYDGFLESASPVAVKVDVTDVPEPPVVTAASFASDALSVTFTGDGGPFSLILVKDGTETLLASSYTSGTSLPLAEDDLREGVLSVKDNAGNITGAGYYVYLGTSSGVVTSVTGTLPAAIYGFAGGDTIIGTAQADYIFGGSGNDTITGGSGADVMSGGSNNDTFVFAAGASGTPTTTNFDTITDYGVGNDKIDYGSTLLTKDAGTGTGLTVSSGVVTGGAANLAAFITALGNSSTTNAGSTLLYATGGDSYIFISDGTAGLGSNDVLIKIVGVAATSYSISSGDITTLSTS